MNQLGFSVFCVSVAGCVAFMSQCAYKQTEAKAKSATTEKVSVCRDTLLIDVLGSPVKQMCHDSVIFKNRQEP